MKIGVLFILTALRFTEKSYGRFYKANLSGLETKNRGEVSRGYYAEGEPISKVLSSLEFSKLDYIALLAYYFSLNVRTTFSADEFDLPFSMGCPGDTEKTENFYIKIYESPTHYKNRSKCNKVLDKSLYYMRRL